MTHKAMVTDAAVERMARWLAKNEGLDPDLEGSHFHEDPVWMEFADDAREALALAQAETQPVAWQCDECGCRTYARVDARQVDGRFAPGPEVRCVECKRVSSPVPAKREAGVDAESLFQAIQRLISAELDSALSCVDGGAPSIEKMSILDTELLSARLKVDGLLNALSTSSTPADGEGLTTTGDGQERLSSMSDHSCKTSTPAPVPDMMGDFLKPSTTARGFGLLTFTDRNGTECTLQESSLATEAAIWLGTAKLKVRRMPGDGSGWHDVDLDAMLGTFVGNERMHLTQDHVRSLLPALQHFAELGELPTDPSPQTNLRGDEYEKGREAGIREAIQIASEQAAAMAEMAVHDLPEASRSREAMEAALTRFAQILRAAYTVGATEDPPTTPSTNLSGEQVDYPKILYVCENCFEHNEEACGNPRDRVNVTSNGRWLCDDCRDDELIDVSDCRDAPKLYTAPSKEGSTDE